MHFWKQLLYKENGMRLVGIIAKKKDISMIRKELQDKNIKIIEITKESIKNIKNIKLEEIILLEEIKFNEEEYKYMNKLIQNSKYLILNGDIESEILQKIQIEHPIKIVTFGFNSKTTITISSINEEKIIVCIQRELESLNGKKIESQEKEIYLDEKKNKKIYNNLVVFIIKELNNL